MCKQWYNIKEIFSIQTAIKPIRHIPIVIVNIVIIIRVNDCDNFYQPRVINLEQSTVPYNFDWTCYTSTDNTFRE